MPKIETTIAEDIIRILPRADREAALMNRRVVLSERKLRICGADDALIARLRAMREVAP
jgi:hypothetical protein